MKVSAVMPTRGRQEYAKQAVEVFLSQTYADKELVILDDGDEPSFPGGMETFDDPFDDRIRYYCGSVTLRYQIPAKRNMVNKLAQGEIIWHLDSDDWSAPTRMADQVARLQETGKAVTGYHDLLFYRESDGAAFEYHSSRAWACGSSLCYLKSFWQLNHFPENKATGSDNHFVRAARDAGELDAIPGGQNLVARIHADNTSKKERLGPEYRPIEPTRIPHGFAGHVLA